MNTFNFFADSYCELHNEIIQELDNILTHEKKNRKSANTKKVQK